MAYLRHRGDDADHVRDNRCLLWTEITGCKAHRDHLLLLEDIDELESFLLADVVVADVHGRHRGIDSQGPC